MTITLDAIKTEHSRLAEMIAKFEAQAKTPRLFSIPQVAIELKDGEHYAGLIVGKDGAPSHHLILLAGAAENLTWKDAQDWAKKSGGDLPTRREQSLLYANLKEQFESSYYWSGEAYASYSDYAWSQHFGYGTQYDPYLLRWWLIARNRVANAYLHCFKRSDDDRAHHGHPWLFNFTLVLWGSYTQHRILAGGVIERRVMKAGDWTFRWGASPHRIELHDGDCWTLFITGPRVREWGFHCPERGWVHWKDFTAPGQPGQIGKGCEQ